MVLNSWKLLLVWNLLLCLFFSCKNTAPQTNKTVSTVPITMEKAIEMAEDYVREQGYTHMVSELPFSKIIFEADEYATDTAKLLTTRHNLLLSQAYHARTYKGNNGQSKWAIGFEFTEDNPNIGRCVLIDTLGNELKLSAKEIRLDWLEEGDFEKDNQRGK